MIMVVQWGPGGGRGRKGQGQIKDDCSFCFGIYMIVSILFQRLKEGRCSLFFSFHFCFDHVISLVWNLTMSLIFPCYQKLRLRLTVVVRELLGTVGVRLDSVPNFLWTVTRYSWVQ